jgi:phthalate 4,5-cis-dihydrodiol dehydrogenase
LTQDRPFRFGIIGIGTGASNLLDGFRRSPHVKVTAVADVRKDAADAFGREFECDVFYDAEALCESPNVDAVWVATPNHLHAEHAIMALDHKKHVTVSKPMAVTLEECEAMCQAAERNGVRLLCGHTQAMFLPIQKMAEVVQSGEFGKLAMLHSWNFTDWVYRPRMAYELDPATGGGVVFRQSPHHIDICRLIAGGKVKSVRAQTIDMNPDRPTTGAFVAYLEFEPSEATSGATGGANAPTAAAAPPLQTGVPCTIIYSGYGHFSSSELTFGGGYRAQSRVTESTSREEEEAMKDAARYGGSAREERQAAAQNGGGRDQTHGAFGLTIASCEKADIRQSPHGLWIYEDDGKREITFPPEYARGEKEFEELYEAAVHGKNVVHDGRWGMATHEVTLAIYESAKTGREVQMKHQVGLPTS